MISGSIEYDGIEIKTSINIKNLELNIGIDENAYLLHYNAYEIAPYLMGPTDIRIGFEELK